MVALTILFSCFQILKLDKSLINLSALLYFKLLLPQTSVTPLTSDLNYVIFDVGKCVLQCCSKMVGKIIIYEGVDIYQFGR